ncbi:hypothetical protein [Desulfurobacterium sp.]
MRKALTCALLLLLTSASALAIEKIPLKPELKIHVTRREVQVVRFPYNVLSAVVDTSKGIQVQAQGKDLLIKWNPAYKLPAVIVVTVVDDKGQTYDYTIVAVPDRKFPEVVEAVLPEEKVEEQKRKKAAEFEKGMPYEKLLVTLTKQFMTGKYPDYYSVEKVDKPLGIFKEIDVFLTSLAKGEKFLVLKGFIKNRLNAKIHIDETVLSFLSREYDVKSISVRKHDLEPGEMTDFVVIAGRKD